MPVIRSAVRNALSDAIGKTIASPWRYFPTFDPVLNGHGVLDTAFTPSGDFSIRFSVYVPSGVATNTTHAVIGATGGADDNVIYFRDTTGSDPLILWQVPRTGGNSYPGVSINYNELTTIEARRTGNDFEIENIATGELFTLSSVTDYIGEPFGYIGRWGASAYFDGIIANVKLTDLATSSNSRIFPLALGPGSSVENSTINSGSVTYTNIPDANRDLFTFDERYLVTFDPALNSYGVLDTAFTPSGDFEVEASVSTTNTVDAFQCVLSGTANGTDEISIFVRSSGEVRVLAYVGTTLQTIIDTAGVTANDGNLHAIKLTYTGTTAELFIDGVSEGSATWALNGSQDIKYIGSRAGASQYFDGIMANVKLTDLATPANSRIFPLALGPGSSVENSTINSGSVTYTNIPDGNRELYTFDEANNRWVANDGSPIIDLA